MDPCYDLLEPKAKETMALDDKNGRVPVSTMDEFYKIYSIGIQQRNVAHTRLNNVSSRSHAVLFIAVRNGGVNGKLNIINLAGNEDNKGMCNKGIRLQESAKINQSIFTLSNVIYALNNNEPRISFKESKLTQNPGSYEEVVHTISLVARSCHIVNYFGSVRREEIPNETIDMEVKLRA
ncbi:hypothetical protein IEQ34_015233 [Dendrobium chrysotoxum]|uniref:Kinesin motor domain-containing protein n=1 Tax=Dendrobium chrysotoxum TaxID=161865 RepID=A0AAV7GFM7_DENCH|nr:hypothetical protein IEQ34_015233 [Dendrobium chrysotoxum]